MTRPCSFGTDESSSSDGEPPELQRSDPPLLVPLTYAAETVISLRRAKYQSLFFSRNMSQALAKTETRGEAGGQLETSPGSSNEDVAILQAANDARSDGLICAERTEEAYLAAVKTYERLYDAARRDPAFQMRGNYLYFTEDGWASAQATTLDCPLTSLPSDEVSRGRGGTNLELVGVMYTLTERLDNFWVD